MNIARTLVSCSIAVLLATSLVGTQGVPPSQLPLVYGPDLHYLGSFAVEESDGTGRDEGRLTYGGTALSVNPADQTMFFGGHDWYQRLCKIVIPPIGGVARLAGPCVDVTEGGLGKIDPGNTNKLGGTLLWNGRLIVSAFSYYDADNSQTLSHFAVSPNLDVTGDVKGPVRVGTTGAGWVSGYMTVIPEEWRSQLGGPAFTGQCCLAIVSRTSSGPSLSVFNPDDIGRRSPVPATTVLGYPESSPLSPWRSTSTLFNGTTNIGGVIFPPGTRSVLFIGKQGTGAFCYGGGAECGDSANDAQGTHAYPYIHQVWAYDANDLVAVRQGLKQPWEVRPYATWRLPEMNDHGSAAIAGAAYDPTTRRLYVTEKYGENPRVHVYEVAKGSALKLPPAPGGLVGKIRGSQVALSWTPPAGPGWAGYVLEVGRQPGTSEVLRLPVAMGATTFSSEAPPGQFFVRLRSASLTGALSPPSNEIALHIGGLLQPPGAPRNFEVRSAGDAVVFTWQPPTSGDPVADYVIDAGTSPSTPDIANGASVGSGLAAVVNSVPPGRYYVRLRARNLAGSGEASPITSVVVGAAPTAPPPPTNLSAQVGPNRSVTLSWDLPDSGSAATGFLLEAGRVEGRSDVGVVAVGPGRRFQLDGVPPGTYFVRVSAFNVAGRSVATRDLRIVI